MARFLISLLAGGCWLIATAAPGSIGVIRSNGDFRVDGSTVRGNGTVFDGNVIETTAARSVMQLDGVQITLGPDSRARVYRDRTVLERGAGLLRDTDKHVIEAASLRIAPSARDSVIQVDVEGPGRISVSSRSGGALVRNADGVLVASLRPGAALEFDTPAGASPFVKIHGTVQARGGNFFVTDTTTGITFQVKGPIMAHFVGKQVTITASAIPGARPPPGASQVVLATNVQLATAGAASGTAGGAASGTAGGAAVAGTTVAVIGGVAIAATVAGLAASGELEGKQSTSAR